MRQRWMQTLPLWAAAAWWGSLTTLGFFVVPMLFARLPSPAIAGNMAAQLFSMQTAISAVCALVLLVSLRAQEAQSEARAAQSASLFVIGGVLLALLVEFGVAPHIVARDNLALWHRIGSAMYLGQWVCATAVFGKLAVR